MTQDTQPGPVEADIAADPPLEPTMLRTDDGVEYPVLLPHAATDAIQRQLAGTRAPYEEALLKDLRERCSGGLVVDVGANVGNHALYLLHTTGCRVVALEPDAELAGLIERAAAEGGVEERLTVIAKAVGAETGTAWLSDRDEANIGQQHLLAEGASAREVEVVTLDDLGLTGVCAVKVDVEGHEVAVLEGATGLLRGQRPVVYIECLTIDEFRRVEEMLHELGYAFEDSFSATPTHCFVPRTGRDSAQRRAALLRAMEHFYAAYEAHATVREYLASANVKYRAATARVDQLKQQLDASRASATRQLEELREQVAQAASSGSDVALRQAELERHEAQADASRAALEAQRTSERLAAQLELTGALKSAVAAVERNLAEAARDRDDARADIARLRDALDRAERQHDEARATAEDQRVALASERDALREALTADLDAARAECDELRDALAQARSACDEASAAGDALRADLAAARGEIEDTAATLASLTAALTAAEETRDGLAAAHTAAEERLARTLAELETATRERDDAESRRIEAEEQAAADRAKTTRQREDFRTLRAWISQAQEREAEAAESTATTLARAGELESENARLREAAERHTAAAQEQEQELARLRERARLAAAQDTTLTSQAQALQLLGEELEKKGKEMRHFRRRAEGSEARVAELEPALATATARASQGDASAAELRQRVDELTERLAAATREQDALRAQLRDVRASATFEAGKALRQATSVGGAMRLPGRLLEINRNARSPKETNE